MRDLVAMPGPLGCLENRLAGVVGRAEIGSEAALVTDARSRGRAPSSSAFSAW